jgi:hypothetical protein
MVFYAQIAILVGTTEARSTGGCTEAFKAFFQSVVWCLQQPLNEYPLRVPNIISHRQHTNLSWPVKTAGQGRSWTHCVLPFNNHASTAVSASTIFHPVPMCLRGSLYCRKAFLCILYLESVVWCLHQPLNECIFNYESTVPDF